MPRRKEGTSSAMGGSSATGDVRGFEGVASNRPWAAYPVIAEGRNTFSRSLIVSVKATSKVKGLSLRRQEESALWTDWLHTASAWLTQIETNR